MPIASSSCGEFVRQKRRPDLLPSVCIDFTTEETGAIGSLFADDLGPQGQIRIIDQQAAALAGNDVPALMKAVCAQVANRTKRSPFVTSHHTLSRIFYDLESMALGNSDDRIHLASHAGVMHRDDCRRPRRYGR